ncbi:prefoldin subunit, putative [Plasmodium sp. gorilla clade G3]|nr:prefoldin subunit, putative [Plasmodium sp. gorilla clade G3]
MSQEKISQIIKDISALKTSCEKLNSQLDELITQKVENEMLLEEVKVLEDDSVLHKLVGLVLVKEEKSKCYDTISRRLQYITGEIENRKKVINSSEEKLRKLFSDLEAHTGQRKIPIPQA